MHEYNWKDRLYPYFYPAEDVSNRGTFIVEFALVCYPYSRGDYFRSDAFPNELVRLGENGSTKFWFLANTPSGRPCENLDWETACGIANELNGAYEDILDHCSETWEWDQMPFSLGDMSLMYNK